MLPVPDVGVVIANYNNAPYIREAILSVTRQTVRSLKVVVIDDASTDDSDAVIRQCLAELADSRISYIKLESNGGQTAAIRRGLGELDTPFVAFIDADDVWYEDFVARHLEAHLNADFPVALTYCDSRVIDGEGKLLAGTTWFFESLPDAAPVRLLDPVQIPSLDAGTGTVTFPRDTRMIFRDHWSLAMGTNGTSGLVLRRSFIDLVLRPDSKDLRVLLDFYLSTFAWLLTGVIAIYQPLYSYRMHGGNMHSNRKVLGGGYNTSSTPFGPKAEFCLGLIEGVLQTEGERIRLAFGEWRYSEAQRRIRETLHPEPLEPPRKGLFGAIKGLFGG